MSHEYFKDELLLRRRLLFRLLRNYKIDASNLDWLGDVDKPTELLSDGRSEMMNGFPFNPFNEDKFVFNISMEA